nr:hypothetical protein BaRGS_023176 [Batillaria attramentaria]
MADQEASTADAVEEPMEGVEEAEKPSGSEAENVNNAKSENADSTSDEDAKKGDEDAKKGENADITSDGDAKKDENEVALAAPVYEDDGGAASEAEFEAEDDRFTLTDYTDEVSKWPWHIEVYPVDTEDLLLDNFNKICLTASYSQIVFRTNSNGEKVGEVHLYAEDAFKARGIMRVLLWRKLKKLKPFVYIYRRKEEGTDEYETAFLRLNVIESSKMRRQELRKESKAEARLRLAKVTNVPLDTSKDMLNVIFARVSQMKRHTDKSDEEAKDSEMQTESEKQTEGSESEAKAESAEKMPESAEKMPESTEKTAESTEEKTESTEKQSDKPESKTDGEKNKEDISDDKGGLPEETDELDGDFNGTVTLDFFGKTSLRGFLLGYPKVVIGENQVEIKPISEELNMAGMRATGVSQDPAEEAAAATVVDGGEDNIRICVTETGHAVGFDTGAKPMYNVSH